MDGTSTEGGGEQARPVARMMMSVAGHAITSYVQFRALAEVLIEKGVLERQELEDRFTAMRRDLLDKTVDEWFEPDIAYHLKMAIRSSMGAASAQPAQPENGAAAAAGPDGGGDAGRPDAPGSD